MRRHVWWWTALGLPALLLVIQLVPYGRAHTNPPVVAEPPWDTPQTRALAVRACYDCHSNETVWPWYSNVAPISWRVQQHVDTGRAKVNFSEWNRPQREAANSASTVANGEMPTRDYVLIHAAARLSPTEQADLIRGLTATFGAGGGSVPPRGPLSWLTRPPVSPRALQAR